MNPHNESDNKNRRIGIAIIKVLTKHSIKLIPIVGPYLEVGYDLLEAVGKEILVDADLEVPHGKPLKPGEIAKYLRHVSPADAASVVDTELASPDALHAIESLSAEQRADLRRKLIRIPSDIDQVIADVEAKESLRARQRAEVDRRKQLERYEYLKTSLTVQMKEMNWPGCERLIEELLSIDPTSEEILQAEAFVHRRLEPPVWHSGCLGAWGSSGFIMLSFYFIMSLFGIKEHDKGFAVASLFMLLLIIINILFNLMILPKLWPRLSRKARKRIVLLYTCMCMIFMFVMFIGTVLH